MSPEKEKWFDCIVTLTAEKRTAWEFCSDLFGQVLVSYVRGPARCLDGRNPWDETYHWAETTGKAIDILRFGCQVYGLRVEERVLKAARRKGRGATIVVLLAHPGQEFTP